MAGWGFLKNHPNRADFQKISENPSNYAVLEKRLDVWLFVVIDC